LRQAFNSAAGKVRVVALVSPTCGACLRGAADMQTGVFAKISDPRLRGFIVWVPKLDGHENNVPEATHTVADSRATHFWDTDGYLVHAYDQTLQLGQDAWDIYLLYGPDTRRDGDQPPTPQYWMTQLGGTDGPFLDAKTFADRAPNPARIAAVHVTTRPITSAQELADMFDLLAAAVHTIYRRPHTT
jgi:hypothetical protein